MREAAFAVGGIFVGFTIGWFWAWYLSWKITNSYIGSDVLPATAGPKRLGEVVDALYATSGLNAFCDKIDTEFLGHWQPTLEDMRPMDRHFMLKDIRGLCWAMLQRSRGAHED